MNTYDYIGRECTYSNLSYNELSAITAYMDGCDINPVIEIIEKSEHISQGMRAFVVEMILYASSTRHL